MEEWRLASDLGPPQISASVPCRSQSTGHTYSTPVSPSPGPSGPQSPWECAFCLSLICLLLSDLRGWERGCWEGPPWLCCTKVPHLRELSSLHHSKLPQPIEDLNIFCLWSEVQAQHDQLWTQPHIWSLCLIFPKGACSGPQGTSYLRKIPLRLGVESKALAGTVLILLFCRYRYSSDSGSPAGISVS